MFADHHDVQSLNMFQPLAKIFAYHALETVAHDGAARAAKRDHQAEPRFALFAAPHQDGKCRGGAAKGVIENPLILARFNQPIVPGETRITNNQRNGNQGVSRTRPLARRFLIT